MAEIISIPVLLSFLMTSFIIELTPGPNMTYLAIISASEGRKYGFSATIGVAIGLFLIGIAAALGVATIISQSPILYELLRWCGVLYLLYLAWDSWKEDKENSPAATELGIEENRQKLFKFFRRGLITNVLNPKAAVFYVSILPTFIIPAGFITAQALLLTVLYVSVATIIHVFIVIMAAQASSLLLQNPVRMKIARRFFAILLCCIAVWFGFKTIR